MKMGHTESYTRSRLWVITQAFVAVQPSSLRGCVWVLSLPVPFWYTVVENRWDKWFPGILLYLLFCIVCLYAYAHPFLGAEFDPGCARVTSVTAVLNWKTIWQCVCDHVFMNWVLLDTRPPVWEVTTSMFHPDVRYIIKVLDYQVAAPSQWHVGRRMLGHNVSVGTVSKRAHEGCLSWNLLQCEIDRTLSVSSSTLFTCTCMCPLS